MGLRRAAGSQLARQISIYRLDFFSYELCLTLFLQEAVGESFELGDAEDETGGEVNTTGDGTGKSEGAEAGEEAPAEEIGEEEAANLPAEDAEYDAGSQDAQEARHEDTGSHGAQEMAQVEEVEEEVEGGDH